LIRDSQTTQCLEIALAMTLLQIDGKVRALLSEPWVKGSGTRARGPREPPQDLLTSLLDYVSDEERSAHSGAILVERIAIDFDRGPLQRGAHRPARGLASAERGYCVGVVAPVTTGIAVKKALRPPGPTRRDSDRAMPEAWPRKIESGSANGGLVGHDRLDMYRACRRGRERRRGPFSRFHPGVLGPKGKNEQPQPVGGVRGDHRLIHDRAAATESLRAGQAPTSRHGDGFQLAAGSIGSPDSERGVPPGTCVAGFSEDRRRIGMSLDETGNRQIVGRQRAQGQEPIHCPAGSRRGQICTSPTDDRSKATRCAIRAVTF
jgi:hypothetical protein